MAKPTRTLLGQDARNAIWMGVNAVYEPVKRTIGPEGKNALLYRTFNRGSRITNDGKTVGSVQEPKDNFVRLAKEAFVETCNKTNERVGDGTTTTTIIGGRLFNDVFNVLSDGANSFSKRSSKGVMALRKEILATAKIVKEKIKEVSIKIETLEQLERIAIVSVEDKDLGKVIAGMAWEVGIDGYIDTAEGFKGEIETEIIKGMRFPAKVSAKAFVNNPGRYEMVAIDCKVLVTNNKLDNASELGKVFQELNSVTSKLIIIAPSFSDNVLVNMVNATKSGFFMYPVSVPSLRTEQFEDLAVYCGATFIDKNKGKSIGSSRPENLGFLEKLVVKDTDVREEAVATGGGGTQEFQFSRFKEAEGSVKKEQEIYTSTLVNERIETLKQQILEETRGDKFKKLLERRIASMSSAVGIIRVGDATEASAYYKKLKIEDAVYACKAALRGGYVKGGGLCLKEIADELPDGDLLKNALIEPYNLIQESVDGGAEITEEIIDPTEVPYYAVEFAVSVVSTLITVDIITPEIDDPVHGEGEFAIAQALHDLSLTLKRHYGQINENEELQSKHMTDNLTGGLTMQEYMEADKG